MTWWQALVNLGFRTAYRLAYPPATIWWRLKRHDGVSVIVWVGDRVCVVHHSYKGGLQIPTGGVFSGEDPLLAATRELHEETGIQLDPSELHWVMTRPTPYGQRYVYEVRREVEPSLTVDLREIVYAGFHPPHEVIDPDRKLVGYLLNR